MGVGAEDIAQVYQKGNAGPKRGGGMTFVTEGGRYPIAGAGGGS